jgi:hypothetical protein
MPQQRGGIVGRLLEGEQTIDIGGSTVSLLLEGNDLPGLCQGRQNPAE